MEGSAPTALFLFKREARGWRSNPVSKVLALTAWGPQSSPLEPIKKSSYGMHYPARCWGNRVRSLVLPGQSAWLGKLQAREKHCLRTMRGMASQEWHPAASDLPAYTHTHTHSYLHICVHTHPCTHINAFIHTYTHIHLCAHTSTYTHKHIHTYTHPYKHIHNTHSHTYIQSQMHVRPHTHMCTHTHIHVVTHIHACLETIGVGRLGLPAPPLWGLLMGTCPLWVHAAFVLWVCITHFPVNPRSLYGYQSVKLD